jgi:hypothetical protein
MKNRITTGFNSLSDSSFSDKAESIYESMNGNANFPSPIPALADVSAAVTAYSTALITAQSRDKNDVAIKNQNRDALTDVLTQLASYVMLTANGDRAMLVSSGFDLAKEPQPSPIAKPDNVQVVNGINAGELVVSVTAVKGAKSYVHQYTGDPVTAESDWMHVNSTSSKYTFRNLDSAKRYWCRVAAVGSYDQVVVSDPVSRIVL